MSKTKTNFCTLDHQPLDYDDFRAHCSNVRAWEPWIEPGRMHIGECNCCGSSVTFSPPADLDRPEDYSAAAIEEIRPHLFWDAINQVYSYYDGGEQGVCQHASTTDVLDLLGDDQAPTIDQLHALGDDWGFRPILFTDRRGRFHTLHAETYRKPSCFAPYDAPDETLDELEDLQRRAVQAAGMVS